MSGALDIYYKTVETGERGSLLTAMRHAASELKGHLASQRSSTIIMRITLFVRVEDTEELERSYGEWEAIAGAVLGGEIPPYSIVSQFPRGGGSLACEAVFLSNFDGEYSCTYKKIGGVYCLVLSSSTRDEIVASGIKACSRKSFAGQVEEVFAKVREVLYANRMEFSNIIRQWSYIGNITGQSESLQNYQVFNNIRAKHYDSSVGWRGFPAATGIGMQTGGIVIDFIAARFFGESARRYPLRNPLQIDAYKYSEGVLVGADSVLVEGEAQTPRFERAVVVCNDKQSRVIISGTAAIAGEKTILSGNISGQTYAALNNIDELVTRASLDGCATAYPGCYNIVGLRVYVKYERDVEQVTDIIEDKYSGVPFLVVVADVCRDDLLVEIEGEYICNSC